MDRIVVARIVGVVGFVCAGAPLDALAQQCVNTASPQCAYVASQVGDFDLQRRGDRAVAAPAGAVAAGAELCEQLGAGVTGVVLCAGRGRSQRRNGQRQREPAVGSAA